VDAFLRKHGEGRAYSITPDAMQRLCGYSWDGNARELENSIERALAFAEKDELGPDDIPIPDTGTGSSSSMDATQMLEYAMANQLTLSELGERYTAHVLESTKGNKARAAKILGINRRTLYRWGFGSQPEGEEPPAETRPA
jgi:DNA-binding NtrC family response regulator